MPSSLEPTLAYAQQQDRKDKLAGFRSRFYLPQRPASPAADPPHSANPPHSAEPPIPPATHSADPPHSAKPSIPLATHSAEPPHSAEPLIAPANDSANPAISSSEPSIAPATHSAEPPIPPATDSANPAISSSESSITPATHSAEPPIPPANDSANPAISSSEPSIAPAITPVRLIYFCGNSLGLQPRSAEEAVRQELADWRNLAIDGYWQAKQPWMTYSQSMQGTLSRLAGCQENEVTVMNALTVNLHLLLLTFYRPGPKRYKILIEAGAFPSDQYAVETQVSWHGRSPHDAIVEVGPRKGERLIREEDLVAAIDREKDSLALVLLGGVNYYTGQLFDMAAIAAAAHKAGALVGFDLAHAIGNTPLSLHDWGADFAVWCSYKYLNGGPGAAGGAFVHERWIRDGSLPRLGGWWGNDDMARFQSDHNSLPTATTLTSDAAGPGAANTGAANTGAANTRAAENRSAANTGSAGGIRRFTPKPTAEGWSMSTAQVFNMVCLRASLALFEEAGFEKLRAKSTALTSYLYALLSKAGVDILTPAEPERRGAQLSLYFGDRGKHLQQQLAAAGIVVDYREPGVIRVSPAPLYNSFEDVYRFCHILGQLS